jgi:GntR family transcriptional regulator
MKFNRQNPTPLFEQVKNLILERIESGELRPHQQIPSEREWEEQLGISRQTIRRAIDELVHTHLLYRHPGKGTYVAAAPPVAPIQISGHTLITTNKHDHSFTTVRIEQTGPPDFVHSLLKLQEDEQVVFVEQVQRVRGEPRYVHRSYLPLQIGIPLLDNEDSHLPLFDMLITLCRQTPVLGRERLSPIVLTGEDADLLGLPAGMLAQRMVGVVLDPDDQVIEAHELVIRADHFKLDFEFDLAPSRAADSSDKL